MGLFSFFKKKKEPKSAWEAVMDSQDFKEQNELYDVTPEQNATGKSGVEATKKVRPPSTSK